MRVPLSWLKEFIDLPTDDPAEIKAVIDMIGHEVEGFEILDAGWSDVVVGKVREISEHPDADKVRVCQVDIGTSVDQIICGAWNFSTGAHVAVARPGAVLPGEFEIGQRTIRGVESNGMICSETELGLGDDHTGILVLDGEPEPGADFSDLVELPDVVFDIAITSNRPDAMSILGIARELAAHYDIRYRVPELAMPTVPGATRIKISVEDREGCRRFTAREITGVEIRRSPLRVRHRLNKAGVRAISNVVDVTNYVMLELGHPLHAFDADAISGQELVVRRASEGETMVTLDDVTRKLTTDDLIIYDTEGPTSMSGTMGGARSEVSNATTSVLMEAASWDPPTIMYMSRRHGLLSEASIRFERGVDPGLADIANQRASAMVAMLANGEVLEGAVDVSGDVTPVEVVLRLDDVERLLGPGFEQGYVSGILERLGMTVSGDDPMTVTVPTYRPDVTRPADLVEEVARIHGFDKFGATVPTGPAGFLTPEQQRLRRAHRVLAGIGLNQAINLPFVGEEDMVALGRSADLERMLQVKNPLREEEGRLRPTLLPGLLNVARYNVSRGERSVAVFETGLVFTTDAHEVDPRLPAQTERIAWVLVGNVGPSQLGSDPLQSDARYSLAVLRHLLAQLGIDNARITRGEAAGFHPGRTGIVELDGRVIGHAGELAPGTSRSFDLPGRVAVAELDLGPLLDPVALKPATTPSPFPPVDFDLSFVVSTDVATSDLLAKTTSAAGGMVEFARVFDEFHGGNLAEGERAIAIAYRIRAADRTLTNEEVAPIRTAMIAAGESLGARLRGAG
ncbi:MAG: phenylalanine--tRNA ligase subunit beta [Acidimicrobiia bacterium]